jgi:hypothetical protein
MFDGWCSIWHVPELLEWLEVAAKQHADTVDAPAAELVLRAVHLYIPG